MYTQRIMYTYMYMNNRSYEGSKSSKFLFTLIIILSCKKMQPKAFIKFLIQSGNDSSFIKYKLSAM